MCLVVLISACSVCWFLALCATPQLDISRLGANQVKIHFESDAGSTYYLEYINALPCTNWGTNFIVGTNWSNFLTVANYPFPNHWYPLDTCSNHARFYRLRVTTP